MAKCSYLLFEIYPRFKKQRFLTVIRTILPLVPILTTLNTTVCKPRLYFFEIHFNTPLPSTPGSPNWPRHFLYFLFVLFHSFFLLCFALCVSYIVASFPLQHKTSFENRWLKSQALLVLTVSIERNLCKIRTGP